MLFLCNCRYFILELTYVSSKTKRFHFLLGLILLIKEQITTFKLQWEVTNLLCSLGLLYNLLSNLYWYFSVNQKPPKLSGKPLQKKTPLLRKQSISDLTNQTKSQCSSSFKSLTASQNFVILVRYLAKRLSLATSSLHIFRQIRMYAVVLVVDFLVNGFT